jgi:hypothetical protein
VIDESFGDLLSVGRCIAYKIAQKIRMLLNVVGVGLVGTIAPSPLDCGEIVFLDGSNQPAFFSPPLFDGR